MGVVMHSTSGPALERAGDLAAILTKLEPGDVLFIDEIHRLSKAVEEVLYPAMEDFQLDIVLGKRSGGEISAASNCTIYFSSCDNKDWFDNRTSTRQIRACR